MYHGSTKNDSENYFTELKIMGLKELSISNLWKFILRFSNTELFNEGPTYYHKMYK
jgi:hypothetical protein